MPTESNGDARSPLTFGQLSVLRALQQLPTDRWWETYVSKPMLLLPGTDISAVSAAVTAVADRHESLHMHFVEISSEFIAITMPPGPVRLDVIDLCGDIEEQDAAGAAHERCRSRFQWDSEVAWRAFVVTDGQQPKYLVLILDHMLVDGLGSRPLMGELRELLYGDDEAGRQWLAETPRQPRELALAQRSQLWHQRRAATSQYWDKMLRDLPPEVFPWPSGPADAGRIEAVLRSPRARAALSRTAHRLRISPQSVMLTLTAIAVSSACGQDDVVLTLQASNRYDRRWRDVVTSMNQATPLPVAVGRADGDFDSFARQIHLAGLNAYRHGSYHFDEIVEKVRRARDMELEFDLYFNFMAYDVVGRDDAVPVDLPGPSVQANHPRRQAGQRLDVKIRQGPDMPIEIRADPTLVSAQRLSRLLYWFDDELVRLAGGEPVRVQDCLARAG